MGLIESTCTLTPSTGIYNCAGTNVQINGAGVDLFNNYVVLADSVSTDKKITYKFDCKINEENLFGQVYCNSIRNEITVSCGSDSHVINVQPFRSALNSHPICSFVFDFSSGFALYSAQGKISFFSTNKFQAVPKEIKSDAKNKINWQLQKRTVFDATDSVTAKSNNNYDHMEIKERLNI